MVRSMTGFGRGEEIEGDYRFVVELKALNHRYLDLIIRIPRELVSLEDKIRSFLQRRISRGRVEAIITLDTAGEKKKKIVIDLNLAAAYFDALKKIEEQFKLKGGTLTPSELAMLPDVLSIEKDELDLDSLFPVLEKALEKAVLSLSRQREEEGKRLEQDIISKLRKLEGITERIKKKSPDVLEEYRQRLSKRLDELHGGKGYDQQRFFLEVALFAERCNIEEEIVRLESHLQAFYRDLARDEVIGRKLDFLLQEMHREVNTISAKSNDLEISRLTVEAKAEIEKIREQVQNIE